MRFRQYSLKKTTARALVQKIQKIAIAVGPRSAEEGASEVAMVQVGLGMEETQCL